MSFSINFIFLGVISMTQPKISSLRETQIFQQGGIHHHINHAIYREFNASAWLWLIGRAQWIEIWWLTMKYHFWSSRLKVQKVIFHVNPLIKILNFLTFSSLYLLNSFLPQLHGTITRLLYLIWIRAELHLCPTTFYGSVQAGRVC